MTNNPKKLDGSPTNPSISSKGSMPRYRFCWRCSRKLQGNYHRVVVVDGAERIVHAACVDSVADERVADAEARPDIYLDEERQ